jgi:tetratricopeptide (TPR) repeat protein
VFNATPVEELLPPALGQWLLAPLVDLGFFEAGPMYAEAIEHHWFALVNPDQDAFGLQRALPASFRVELWREFRRLECRVTDPRDLPVALRSPRWTQLCEWLDAWAGLSPVSRSRLVRLLHAMGLYGCIDGLSAPLVDAATGDPVDIETAYWRASAHYMLYMTPRISDYTQADLRVFMALANSSAHAPYAGFNAAVKLFVHAAKTGAGAADLAALLEAMDRRFADVEAKLDGFTVTLLASRYHRARAYLPMREGDSRAMSDHMEESEKLARGIVAATPAQHLLRRENLHPVLESRAKEAKWLGDHALALKRAEEVVMLDRHDPKSWLELAEARGALEQWREAADAYVTAARLAPPMGAISRHMAGAAHQRLGDTAVAAFFFQLALQTDPLAISPRVQIDRLPALGGFDSLKDWGSRKMRAID